MDDKKRGVWMIGSLPTKGDWVAEQFLRREAATFFADLDHDQIGRDLRDFGVTFSVDGKTVPARDVLSYPPHKP